MAIDGPRKKVLVALDLDNTHFFYHLPEVTWIGSQQFWLDTYMQADANAQAQGVDLIFAVVTNKEQFDDICMEAAIAFQPLLTKSNPHMLKMVDGYNWILVQCLSSLQYEYLSCDATIEPTVPQNAFSHFLITSTLKSESILNLAQQYNISARNCLLLDDIEIVLEEAAQQGIQTISFSCFYSSDTIYFNKNGEYTRPVVDERLIYDDTYTQQLLQSKKAEFLSKVNMMVQQINAENIKGLDSSCSSFSSPVILNSNLGYYPSRDMRSLPKKEKHVDDLMVPTSTHVAHNKLN